VPPGCAAAQKAVDMGATLGINSRSSADATEAVLHATKRKGVDVAIEAVGLPTTFELCQARAPVHPWQSLERLGRVGSHTPLRRCCAWLGAALRAETRHAVMSPTCHARST